MNLETDRLIIRDFKKTDWQAVHEYASDLEVVNYMPWGPNTKEETKIYINRRIGDQKIQPRHTYDFALVLKTESRLIGGCSITANFESKQGDLGYILHRLFWNQGYMTEAVRRIIKFGFSDLGLHRISATCSPENHGSRRVLEKCGMQKEGYLRGNILIRGMWRDELLYALLDSDKR